MTNAQQQHASETQQLETVGDLRVAIESIRDDAALDRDVKVALMTRLRDRMQAEMTAQSEVAQQDRAADPVAGEELARETSDRVMTLACGVPSFLVDFGFVCFSPEQIVDLLPDEPVVYAGEIG